MAAAGGDWLVSEIDVVERAERIGALVAAGDNVHFVAEAQDELVGELALAFGDPGPVSLGLSVAPCWRRRGVATELLARALEHARTVGVRELKAEVIPGNEAAIAFLAEHGFREEGRATASTERSSLELVVFGRTLL